MSSKAKPPVANSAKMKEWARERAQGAPSIEEIREISKRIPPGVTQKLLDDRRRERMHESLDNSHTIARARERAKNSPSIAELHKISERVEISITQLILAERRGE